MHGRFLLYPLFSLVLIGCAPSVVAATPSPEITPTASPSPTPTPRIESSPTRSPTSSTAYPSPSVTTTAGIASGGPLAATGCNESVYVRDATIEDGTELAPGEPFTKTWEIRNIGTCAWSRAYSMKFVSGDPMDGFDDTIGRAVKPGDTAKISVSLTAPDEAGSYTGYWMLADKSGNPFGEQVLVQIVVSDEAASSTPTPTSVPASATPLPTEPPTSAPTATFEALPTDTPGS